MKRVLILDASQRSALAVTRSLGRQGVPVFTAEETQGALAGCSKYSKQSFSYPSPRLHPERFIEVLAELVKDQHIDMLLPMTELTTTLLLTHQAAFPGTIMPFPELDQVEALANKCTLLRTAERLGVPVPPTLYIDDPASPPALPDNWSFPVVLKSGKSWLQVQQQWQRVAVRFPTSQLILNTIIKSEAAFKAHPYMIQECVAGEGQGVFALYDHGKPLAFFAHRRLREKPPSGGVSVLSESVTVDPGLEQHARALLDNANWHGIAMVEFKVSPDGIPYLMEINTRFWGSLQLAIDAGVDFPWLLYQAATGAKAETVTDYKVGIRLRWLLGDLDSLYLSLKDQRNSLGAKLGTVLRFLTPAPFRTRHEINRWRDMAPFWCELKLYLHDLFH